MSDESVRKDITEIEQGIGSIICLKRREKYSIPPNAALPIEIGMRGAPGLCVLILVSSPAGGAITVSITGYQLEWDRNAIAGVSIAGGGPIADNNTFGFGGAFVTTGLIGAMDMVKLNLQEVSGFATDVEVTWMAIRRTVQSP